MAKAARKATSKAPEEPVKRPRKPRVPKEEVLPPADKQPDTTTGPEVHINISKPSKLPLIVGGAVVLLVFLWAVLKGCGDPVKRNEKANKPHETNIERLNAELDSLKQKAAEDSAALLNAIHYAELAHEENVRMATELKNFKEEKHQELQKLKKQSDANKNTIKTGTSRELDDMWERIKLSKGIK
jgi:hypothetical protein